MSDGYYRFVNAYIVTRHYGGPEEGGWWWDAGQPLSSTPFRLTDKDEMLVGHNEAMQAEAKRVHELFAEENEGDISSVRGGQAVQILFEDDLASSWPKERPHYE